MTNILEQLKNLKRGETLFINIDKDLSNSVKFYDIKFTSYDNLFMSYINNTSENANKFNLDKFMERYTRSKIEVHELVQQILKTSLGDSYEYFMKNNFMYRIDYNLNVIIIQTNNNSIPNVTTIETHNNCKEQCTCNKDNGGVR